MTAIETDSCGGDLRTPYYNAHDAVYHDCLQHILTKGRLKADRTGTGTISTFGYQMRFDLSDGTVPVLTTKKIYLHAVVHELLWFIQGSGNIEYLKTHNVRIWNEWANAAGDLGPVYGVQWRHLAAMDGSEIDQLAQLIELIKRDPDSRRLIVDSWTVDKISQMALPPCHMMWQMFCIDDTLSMQLYIRSSDAFLGLPFNIAQYGTFLHMIAQVCELGVGELIITIGDLHIYTNHLDQVKTQLARSSYGESPAIYLNSDISNIDDFTFDDIIIVGYESHPMIAAPVAV